MTQNLYLLRFHTFLMQLKNRVEIIVQVHVVETNFSFMSSEETVSEMCEPGLLASLNTEFDNS